MCGHLLFPFIMDSFFLFFYWRTCPNVIKLFLEDIIWKEVKKKIKKIVIIKSK